VIVDELTSEGTTRSGGGGAVTVSGRTASALTTWLLASGIVTLVLGLVFFVLVQTQEVESLVDRADEPGTATLAVAYLVPLVGLVALTAGVVGISRQIGRIAAATATDRAAVRASEP